jgi:hypothetical protein
VGVGSLGWDLELKVIVGLKACLDGGLGDDFLVVPVALPGDLDAREEIPQQPREDDEVVSHNLRNKSPKAPAM